MKTDTTKPAAGVAEGDVLLGENWFDPPEAGVRTRIRGFIEGLLEAELDAALARKRYARPSLAEPEVAAKAPEAVGPPARPRASADGNLLADDGACARARLEAPDGKTAAGKNATIPARSSARHREKSLPAVAPVAWFWRAD